MKKGFTLAEVLITLGIIGVVAAMTIPALKKNIDTAQAVSATKKVYSILTQAYSQAAQENGDPTNWELSADGAGATKVLNALAKYLKIAKDCGTTDFSCFPDVNYKCLNNTNYTKMKNSSNARAQLSNGMSIQTQVWRPDCSADWGDGNYNNVCGSINIDINGFKNPNQFGVDFFPFFLTKNGIIPAGGALGVGGYATFAGYCKDKTIGIIVDSGPNGAGCTAWVIYNENMDYLKCSDLSWDGKHKCGD